MIHRRILADLEAWKRKKDRRPLILRGARQVGKTTVVEEFGKTFDTFLHLNLEKRRDADLFEYTDDPRELIDEIHIHLNKVKREGTVLLFIDEIQNSPKAIAVLRYFYEEIPEVYVIAAGSLLESLVDVHVSFPVGRVEYMAMRPCSFLEFLNGIGQEFDAEVIRNRKVKSVHERIMKYFRQYMILGGMPAVIRKYAENNDILAPQSVYESLITSYRDDSEKYAKNDMQRFLLSHILTSGWAEVAETIAFEGFAGSNYKSREMSEAFRTLERAMLLELVYPVVESRPPVLANMKRRPKLIWLDVGLVNFQAGIREELLSTSDVMDMWRGRVGEQVVGQELLAYSHNVLSKRYFWARDRKESAAEVDFVIQHRGMVVPIEVKTGHNRKLKSLHAFMEQVSHRIAVRVWNQPLSFDSVKTPGGKDFMLINLPFYYLSQLGAIIDEVQESLVG
ncbi:MAG: AAA family ATPase [Paraprevotella sp.]|nr:AAA family ATPase [Paraprevotella sp.]